MPKSTRSGFPGRGSGTVTVIEEPVVRSYARKAKIAFWITWAATGLLAATILAGPWQHRLGTVGGAIAAVVAGGLIGLAVAFITACIVVALPVIRAIWWWLPELLIAGSLVTGWTELAAHTDLAARLAVTAAVIGVPAAIRPVRRFLSAWSWCLVSRHRIRTCFSEFIISNRRGSLPLIFMARPTPAGERLRVLLRPGLSLADVLEHTDRIAAACWASTVTADMANPNNAALVRFDIKRRDPLTGTIASPLAALFGNVIPRRTTDAPAPVALDLTDVTAEDVTPAKGKTAPVGTVQRPQWPHSPAATGDALTGKVATADKEEDLADWI
jgi:hypothetical protein